MDDTRGLECLWTDPSNHPRCPHGPTLLFGKYIDGSLEKFYACSACRDRKLCNFYLKDGEKLTKKEKINWEQQIKKYVTQYPHQKLFLRLNELMAQSPEARCYCHDCEKLIFATAKSKHDTHKITEHLTDYQMTHPTEILKPLENAKKEAQYLFSKKSVEDITNMLVKLGAKQVLCIGTPRIHEYITENLGDQISSVLLDFDGRFHHFFGPLNFCWYNLFNHHFFNEDAAEVFKDFITQNQGRDTYLVADPPFGGRVEAMSWTIKRICDLHKKWNGIEDESDMLKMLFVFPYFMESIIKKKSNPPAIPGGLRDLKMADYKVDYDNHPLYITDREGNKQPSPARIFTNIPLNQLELPESDGYRYCKKCERWVSKENKHCKECRECTSKDGRTYRHCKKCKRCVKPNWKHCKKCNRCLLENHKCGEKPKVTGRCYKCNEYGHAENDCNMNKEDVTEKVEDVKTPKKRKLNSDKPKAKKQKLNDATKPETAERKVPIVKAGLKKQKKKELIDRRLKSKSLKPRKKKIIRSAKQKRKT